LPILSILVYKHIGFIVPASDGINFVFVAGSDLGFRHIDVNTETGKGIGLFNIQKENIDVG
jgi:hypothetical protein